jgi:hypothetical protein
MSKDHDADSGNATKQEKTPQFFFPILDAKQQPLSRTVKRSRVLARHKQYAASTAMNLPTQPLVQTIAGGPNFIFAMARQLSGKSLTNTPAATSLDQSAQLIWRNARKRHKPGMWRYAIRTLRGIPVPQRTAVHYEGALVACTKLAAWDTAQSLVEEMSFPLTDGMVTSLVRTAVRESRRRRTVVGLDEVVRTRAQRRVALDQVRDLLHQLAAHYGTKTTTFPIEARHVNPLADAYQSLGLVGEARQLVQDLLTTRVSGPEDEDGSNRVNIYDINARDKGSCAILVEGAVLDGDWSRAVEALRAMTQENGVFPSNRHLHTWHEVSERKRKQRTAHSWKKKRNMIFLDSVQ